jgi:ABC-type lipoprotein export system ATPase subunit
VIIRRIEVEGGFLDGLDLTLRDGLVVVIGSRGTGKTSLIELIRFALDAGRLTPEADPYKQARAILDGGEVTLTLDVRGEEQRVSRGASDPAPRGLEFMKIDAPLVLAQNEIEELGYDPRGQLNLIDGLRVAPDGQVHDEREIKELLRIATVELQQVRTDLSNARDRLTQLGDLVAANTEARELEQQLSASSSGTVPLQKQLTALTEALSSLKVENDLRRRDIDATRRWILDLQSVLAQRPQLQSPASTRATAADDLGGAAEESALAIEAAIAQLTRAIARTELAHSAAVDQQNRLEAESREVRRQLDDIEEGAGAIAKTISDLQQRRLFANALSQQIKRYEVDVTDRETARGLLLAALDDLRDERHEQRRHVVADLNKLLGPRVVIELTRSGDYSQYTDALIDLLRGSKLRYTTLAPMLASQISPTELGLIVERGEAAVLAAAAGIDTDRAARLIGHLAEKGAEGLFAATVTDAVEIRLLDGDQYKGPMELSTGQRCTAILPILLAGTERGLIIDQPEDHLDNAFVVETVINALNQRRPGQQMIFSTHNANIPVLGDADVVVVLDSNGRRGFKRQSGTLNDDSIVTCIKSIMEGGSEAFERRATFYARHSLT